MSLFAMVRAKRPRLIVAPLSALQGLSNFPLISQSNSPRGYFSLELRPHRSELSPVHRRLLPRYFKAPAVHRKRKRSPSSAAEEAPRPIMIWPRAKNLKPSAARGRRGKLFPSPQILAGGPLIEDGGFATRKSRQFRVGAMALRRNPRKLLKRRLRRLGILSRSRERASCMGRSSAPRSRMGSAHSEQAETRMEREGGS